MQNLNENKLFYSQKFETELISAKLGKSLFEWDWILKEIVIFSMYITIAQLTGPQWKTSLG